MIFRCEDICVPSPLQYEVVVYKMKRTIKKVFGYYVRASLPKIIWVMFDLVKNTVMYDFFYEIHNFFITSGC